MADTLDFPFPSEFLDVDSLVNDSLTSTCTETESITYDSLLEPYFTAAALPDDCMSSVVQVPKPMEKSPFHESDSGVSEASAPSGFFGNSPIRRQSTEMLDEMLDSMQSTSFLLDKHADMTDQDLGLMNYLGGRITEVSAESSQTEVGGCRSRSVSEGSENLTVCASQQSDAGRLRRSTLRPALRSRQNLKGSACEIETESDDSDIEIIETPKRGRRLMSTSKATRGLPRGSVKSTRAREVLASSSSSEKTVVKEPRGSIKAAKGQTLPSLFTSPNCNVTSVRVVRVKKVDAASTAQEDIERALEDRNRKNAEIAKMNRQKKKAYVEDLEKEVEDSRRKIDCLESKLVNAELENDACHKEINYLRSVLANQSALAGLLKNIPSASAVSLSKPVSRKRLAEHDHSYNAPKKCSRSSTAGVCLHVDNDNVSLEFCHHCAHNSAQCSR